MNAITTSPQQIQKIREALASAHVRLGQTTLPSHARSLTAKNYDSSMRALGEYMLAHNHALPYYSVLQDWASSMLVSGKSVATVNARLSAIRKLLEAVALDITDIEWKAILRDWAKIPNVKKTAIADEDMEESDYGRRFTKEAVTDMIRTQFDVTNIKGLRDRALVAVMVGAGLRVAEACALTVSDAFTRNERGEYGIRVRRGKHNKKGVVVLSEKSWVFVMLRAYVNALGIANDKTARVFRGVKRVKDGGFVSTEKPLTERRAQEAVSLISVIYQGLAITPACHDFRRTYALLCHKSGMPLENIRANLGHSSVKTTENYIGKDVDWSDRRTAWNLDI